MWRYDKGKPVEMRVFVTTIFFLYVLCSTLAFQLIELQRETESSETLFKQKISQLERERRDLKLCCFILQFNNYLAIEEARRIVEQNEKMGERYGVSPLLLLALQCKESRFRYHVISRKRAVGLNQILPATARTVCRDLGWEWKHKILLNPEKNTELAACYLKHLLEKYNCLDLALAAYNGGPEQAEKYKANTACRETRVFVKQVKQYLEKLGQLYGAELSRTVVPSSGSRKRQTTRKGRTQSHRSIMDSGTAENL